MVLQIDLLAPQADQFRDAEPMAIGEQDHRGVAVAVGSKQPSRGQHVAVSIDLP